MNKKAVATTVIEIVGGICVAVGVGSFNVALGVIVAGVLMIIGGGLAA